MEEREASSAGDGKLRHIVSNGSGHIEPESRALNWQFVTLILLVGVMGAAGAVWADLTDDSGGYRDAVREIGGAVVSGALLAMLVVWFEQRRDNERIQREERRDELAAAQAWRREFDIDLFRGVLHDLQRTRETVRRGCKRMYDCAVSNERRNQGSTAKLPAVADPANSPVHKVHAVVDDLTVICELLQIFELGGAIRDWEESFDGRPKSQSEALVGQEKWAEAEEARWLRVVALLDEHRRKTYG